jgi:hypothetical protein
MRNAANEKRYFIDALIASPPALDVLNGGNSPVLQVAIGTFSGYS